MKGRFPWAHLSSQENPLPTIGSYQNNKLKKAFQVKSKIF